MTIKNRLTPIALLLGLGITAPSQAFEAIELGNGITLNSRISATYTLSQRVKSQDKALAAYEAGNDGDNNFNKNSLTANRLSLLLDATLSKGDTGFVLSASTFYDDVYHRSNDNKGAVNKPGKSNRFTSEAKRYHGGYSRILDAYGYTSFDVGDEGRATVRLGRHVVSWGEGLFFPGISLAQGPADGTKTGIPGTETKDLLLPEGQLSLQYQVTPRWSLLGQAQYEWHPTLAPAPGSFLSSNDAIGEGGSCLGPYATIPYIPADYPYVGFPGYSGFSGCSFGARGADIKPKKNRQWGIGSRFRVTDDTEIGLYYLNYADRTPLPEVNALAPQGDWIGYLPGRDPTDFTDLIGSGSYRVKYFDNIKLIGATFSTTAGPASIAGELSYKDGAPVLIDTIIAGEVMPTPTRANIWQANLNTFINLGRTMLAPETQVLAEVAYVKVTDIKARQAPGAAIAEMMLGPDAAPASKKATFGDSGLAMSATVLLGYPGIFEDWDLSVPISYSQQLQGRTLVGGVGGEGDQRYSIGADFTYQRNLQIGVNYLGYLNSANVTNQKRFRDLTDRDQISLVMKYVF